MSVATVSTVTLNQFALDFEGNLGRILRSVEICKEEGSRLRCGPELDIPGYSCEDHFYEGDTEQHSWEVLTTLLTHPLAQDILVDVGMPVHHAGVNYNTRVVFLNRRLLLIRPKMILCDDGNYRESRWFTGWSKMGQTEPHPLPPVIREIAGQEEVPFGDALLQLEDTCVGFEVCGELWNPQSPHIAQTLAGAEILLNGSGSYAEIRKASYAVDLVKSASAKCGCVYLFSNLRGCDGERFYMNGCSTIAMNGSILKLGDQYSLKDVEVLTASVVLDEIRTYRNRFRSRSMMAARSKKNYSLIKVPWRLSVALSEPTLPLPFIQILCPEEEIARGPALWLWDYLRRSPASGFFLPLSGGVDSSSVAIIVYSMCHLIVSHLAEESDARSVQQVLADVRKVLRIKDASYRPSLAKELCGRILTTCYMGSVNSSEETRERAENLAQGIGSNHKTINISLVCEKFVEETASALDSDTPAFSGSMYENLALQNVQARSRMVFAYLFAQLTPWAGEKDGFLLVLGSANVDTAIRGYFTKYGDSSAYLNPIGGISRADLKNFIVYAGTKFGFPEVPNIVAAPPTAELKPLSQNQTDEEDMGVTYEELSFYGKLRKQGACGPFSMFTRLLSLWKLRFAPEEIAKKVKYFYVSYAMNRHKMRALTPACHMETYSPDDHRYDLRPLIYPLDFSWQFRKIDEYLSKIMGQ